MATGGLLAVRLGKIRRRLRLYAALEGGVVGSAVAMLALAVGVALARGREGTPGMPALAALILLGGAGGALVRGARRIPLSRCARLADAALDGQDRVLSALTLESSDPSPFVRALVADAIRRAESLTPGAAAPARRPAGLPALGIATLALALSALLPASSPAAHLLPTVPPAEHRAAIPAGALDAEREVMRAAAEAATRLGDPRLAALAADFDLALRRLAGGTLSAPAALELLRALEARAAEAAEAAKRDGRAAAAIARALEANDETRSAGTALAQTGASPGDDERASAALGISAAAHPTETARALASAAATLAGAAGESGEGGDAKDRPRRLSRDDSNAGMASERTTRDPSDSEARHLEQLRRDLDDAASTCRAGEPACRPRAEQRGRELAQLGRQGATRDSLQRLQRSAEQLRARVGRGELGDGDAQAMRSFGRAAEGKGKSAAPSGRGDEVSAGAEAAEGDGDGRGSSSQHGDGDGDDARAGTSDAETGAASAAMAAESGGASRNEGGSGNGIGHQPGGAPLGARHGDATGVRGAEIDVPISDGAGPGRAEVIGTAAGRGFASPGYARTFSDYAAAVEDALGATAVPDGKRYLVRRYFDLIRPRPPAHAQRSNR